MTIVVSTTPTGTTRSGISPEEISNLHRERRQANIKVLNAGEQLRRIYNGDGTVPLPELERSERVAIANLIQTGLDDHAQRISSTAPQMTFPPDKNTKAARGVALDRKMAVLAWQYANKTHLQRKQRARYLAGYGSSPVYVMPGDDRIPRWVICDPLSTFPAPGAPNELVPIDCIFAFRRTWKWVHATYGIALPRAREDSPDAMVDILLYMDDREMVMVGIGSMDQPNQGWGMGPPASVAAPARELQRVPNITGRPMAIVPRRVTLDRLQGQFDQMLGMYETQGLLWAMHLQALKRAIFPEEWLVGRPNENPQIVSQADPITGDVGVVEGGVLQFNHADPSVQTLQSMDRLERAQRLNGGVPAELGGESSSNVRTARRGGQILAASVDYQIQEHQDILAASEEEEIKAAIAVAKAYWPDIPNTLLLPWGDGQVTYTPRTTFERDTLRVFFPYSGTDTNGLVIEGEQRVGAGTLSKRGFMEIDPMVQDPDFEMRRIEGEALHAAFLASIQQQAADPNGPYQPIDLARITELVEEKGMQLYEAVQKVHDEAAQRQAAAAAAQPQPGMVPGQPGLSTPGAPGTEGAAIGAPGPNPQQQGMAGLVASLRGLQRGANIPAGGGPQ